jgi:hypothetical protein
MHNCYLYCDKRSLNDATIFYIGIVKEALLDAGYGFRIAHKLSSLRDADVIMTITERYFLQAKLRYPRRKTIYWSQGVDGEEAKWAGRSMLATKFRFFAEGCAVNHADLLLLVSEAMLNYHKQRYGYSRDNNIIMPCFNKTSPEAFNIEQYTKPTFVYAGNASVWQATDLMLDVYACVEQIIPESSLTILSGNKEIFLKKIHERNIKNHNIKYVSLDDIDSELHKYKYGMILREPHIVNKVATPTKMSTYLASYLIPIFTDAVDDFNFNIELGEFKLCAGIPLKIEAIVKMICDFEESKHDFRKYKAFVDKVFEGHYNRENYKRQIYRLLDKMGWTN